MEIKVYLEIGKKLQKYNENWGISEKKWFVRLRDKLTVKNWKENPFKNWKKKNPIYNWKEKSLKKVEIEKCCIIKMKFQLESGTKSPFRNWKKLK